MHKFLFNTIDKGRQYLYSIAVILLASGVCFGLSGFMGYRVAALILLVTVSLLAITFDILPVLASATLSAFIWDFFFIPPRFTIHINTTEDTILLIMYFVIAMISGVLTYKIRQVEKISRLREERANSVKLYNTILNSLSHELRTPIAAIIGAADNLQANNKLTKENREQLINEISKASLRLNQQVENLLNISRLESGHIRPKNDWCDIVELVYELVKRVEENNPKRKINISINQNMPLCNLDKGMLEQIIYNLLNNAAMHTEPNCRIDISAACHADLLMITIEDTGKGFKDVDTREVFDKFSRSKNPKTSGSGLGLSIVKGFTEALGGTVELQKSNSSGSRFVISIPVKTTYPKFAEG
ncbi:MAG TPA: ATP-binding protein [Chitinophagaceae bacterium]|jgi:two-component system sensor histidine kinase KdpD|nr:ATP-binding protein [Chitinophagaceae bacterium]